MVDGVETSSEVHEDILVLVRWPESAERRRSLVTFRRALSVLCWEWKLD